MTNKQLIIASDVDGVLLKFSYTFLKLLKQLTGIDREFHVNFDFSDICNKKQAEMVWNHIDNNPGIVSSIPEIPDAFRGIETLRSIGRVIAVTSPHIGPTWHYERTQALMDNFKFKKQDIIFCPDKYLVPADIFIEDSLENVNTYKKYHPNSKVFLINTPYNQGGTLAIRVQDWSELLDRLSRLT